MEKILETRNFKNSAPFPPSPGKFGQNTAAAYIFPWPLLSYADEESASWEHCCSRIFWPSLAGLVTAASWSPLLAESSALTSA
jgi:hypothetical protein